jgi:hypothetical protein
MRNPKQVTQIRNGLKGEVAKQVVVKITISSATTAAKIVLEYDKSPASLFSIRDSPPRTNPKLDSFAAQPLKDVFL